MTKEYVIESKVKNNLILSKIKDAGFKTVGEFCVKNNLPSSQIGNLVNMKESPLKQDGSFKDVVRKICDILFCFPEDLFTLTQLTKTYETNKFVKEISEEDIKIALGYDQSSQKSLEDLRMVDEFIGTIDEALEMLTPREQKVLKMRFGIDCDQKTLEEVGRHFDVNRERIRQIEAKALRKLRHPSRSEKMIEFIGHDF